MPRSTARTTRTARTRPEEEGSFSMAALQLLLMLAFAFLVFFSRSFDSTPEYSLTKTRTFNQERFTSNGIPFYVARGVDESKLESSGPEIEEAWLRRIVRLCNEEMNERQAFIAKAQVLSGYRKQAAMETLSGKKLPHCELLERYRQMGFV